MASYHNKLGDGIPYIASENICKKSHMLNHHNSSPDRKSISDTSHVLLHESTEHLNDLSIIHPTHLHNPSSLHNGPCIAMFTDLQDAITKVLQQTNLKSPLVKLHTLLSSYSSNPVHWSIFALADPSKKYTRNLICEVPYLFNFLLLVWTPGKSSQIHDHADSHCLMKVLQGELREKRYIKPKNPNTGIPLDKISDLRFGLNQVTYISDELGLHDISNPSDSEYAVSLHLYFPPNAALNGCYVYDINNGRVRHVMQDRYDSVPAEM